MNNDIFERFINHARFGLFINNDQAKKMGCLPYIIIGILIYFLL